MGAALATQLRQQGRAVVWASSGRGPATAERAEQAGLEDTGTIEALVEASDVIVSVCPPHAALEVARSIGKFEGIYVDANAVSPATAREVAEAIEAGGGRFVDGGIVGSPPRESVSPHLYLSGSSASDIAELFTGTLVDARVVSDEPGSASAVKMAYAAWTKGAAALLIAIPALARTEGIEEVLLAEWRESIPDLPDRSARAASAAASKGWRWVGEMEEVARTFEAAGLPGGFHEAAAEVYRGYER
jgi:3-hydroxyisobutyrate dehydrogenase-like beta-hydroxyacid dehydrogenase